MFQGLGSGYKTEEDRRRTMKKILDKNSDQILDETEKQRYYGLRGGV